MSVYPYKFVPIYKDRMWGGRRLERLFGRQLPPGKNIGESWELADLPPTDRDRETESVVANGPDAGKTLNELLRDRRRQILGSARPWDDGRFPLLLKVLDANERLSLQVHPDEQTAKEMGPHARPKTECWYVLKSSGGYILKGVKPGVTRERFAEAAGRDEALLELVQRFEVRDGDFHYLPAGTVHALGAGLVVAEVQIPSDTTFRVSDWGRGREVHLAESLRCIHFAPGPAADPAEALEAASARDASQGVAGDEMLLRTPYFSVRKRLLPPGPAELRAGACAVWMVLAGRGKILSEAAAAPSVPLGRLETVLVPAGLAAPTAVIDEQMTVLEITLPR